MSNNNCDQYNQAKIFIYYCSKVGDLEQIKLLLKKCAVKNIGLTFALYLACKNSHFDIVKYLIDYMSMNDPILCSDGVGKNIMAAACYSGNIGIINLLINYGFNLSVTSLNKICTIKDVTLRKRMLHWITDVVQIDNYETAIINLLKMGDTESIIYILYRISDNQILPILANIIRYASLKNNVTIFDWLIDKYREIIFDDNHTLITCIKHFLNNDNCEQVNTMLNKNDVGTNNPEIINFMSIVCYNACNTDSYLYIATRYSLAIDYDDYMLVRYLTESGKFDLLVGTIETNKTEYNLDIVANDRWKSCLEHCFRSACYYGYINIAQWIYNHGIDPNCESHDNVYNEEDNSLILAAKNGYLNIINWLITIQTHNPTIYNKALHKAITHNKTYNCVEYLIINSSEPVDYVMLCYI
jgi:ankyrin repeat protein